ncbi:hypothetical protein PVAND_009922 [Polypedilum vanderplanki]|uniref:DNA excision repair protein ERCC-1 n=1 Tax=Polypedilum vanderplanki TaxID=319348 RepID=A0A9J6CFM7_POLVA|nr:hypothetical protein PVAND_009922 [Polypedilum vanderplanki]
MDLLDDSFDKVIFDVEIPEDSKQKSEIQAGPSTSSASVSKQNEKSQENQPEKEVVIYVGNAIQVNPCQKGNPLLKSINSIPWEFNEKLIPDYVVGKRACVLFLSVKYHQLKPDYIHERLRQLRKNYELRILLVHVDIKEPHNALKHLTRICLLADFTLMLAWSYEEAGKIIETYKMFENASAERIQEKQETDSYQNVVNALTSIKSINKTDAMTLLNNFGTLENLIQASENQLYSCVGLGPKKAQKLHKLLNQNFLK